MSEKIWSIIIPTLNEQENIGRCLDSLCALDVDREALEVFIIDNGSRDQTVPISWSYAGKLDIRILVIRDVRVGALRNAAVEQARGTFLGFLDADCVVEPDWLRLGARVLQDHPSTIVGAAYAMPPDAGWPARLWHQRFHQGRRGEVSYLPGGNLLMERSLFQRVGGFDTELRSNEDSQFCSRAKALGSRVLAFPELAVIHYGAEKSLRQFVRRQFWHGSNVLSRAALKGNIRAIGLAAYTLACATCLLAFAVLGHPLLVALSLGFMLTPPFLMALGASPESVPRKNLLSLTALLLTYALVRAYVLPLALFRGVRQWSFAAERDS
jgi:glycosyltransferase involved in cell wall biosynthesis